MDPELENGTSKATSDVEEEEAGRIEGGGVADAEDVTSMKDDDEDKTEEACASTRLPMISSNLRSDNSQHPSRQDQR